MAPVLNPDDRPLFFDCVLMGCPQLGQAFASLETLAPHSGQVIRAMGDVLSTVAVGSARLAAR